MRDLADWCVGELIQGGDLGVGEVLSVCVVRSVDDRVFAGEDGFGVDVQVVKVKVDDARHLLDASALREAE